MHLDWTPIKTNLKLQRVQVTGIFPEEKCDYDVLNIDNGIQQSASNYAEQWHNRLKSMALQLPINSFPLGFNSSWN